MTKEKPAAKAPAEPPTARIVPMQDHEGTKPNVLFKGRQPEEGKAFTFIAENGVKYRGLVDEAVSVDGEVCVSFKGDLSPA